ncbi:unnamed protein product [Schistocephalus solidus]|uniref:Reverse transcriptase domain-containing protein n=1 Tax=Schistocephalus solidus TaxID=70667 RepID=A0A183TJG1_SCHSO|nr:unnamed protein product [Schistocephalus solidus]
MVRKAEKMHVYVGRNEMKNFFKAIKAMLGPCIKGTALLFSSDGTTLLTEKFPILKRWAKHFRSVPNCSSAISDAAIDRLPQVYTNNDLHLPTSLPEPSGSDCSRKAIVASDDMIFAVSQLQEKCQEIRTHLYAKFADLMKAFGTVNRDGLWKIMQKFGALSEAFAVTNGVKQGCIFAPTLFGLTFSAMLMDAYREERSRIHIAYRMDGRLLNQ